MSIDRATCSQLQPQLVAPTLFILGLLRLQPQLFGHVGGNSGLLFGEAGAFLPFCEVGGRGCVIVAVVVPGVRGLTASCVFMV
jgi:hypothetical protein